MHEPTLVHQLRFSQMILLKNLEDVTPEQSLIEPESGGNSLNWVVGHVCVARNGMIKVLRGAGHLPEDALKMYQRAGNYSAETALGLGILVTHHAAMQQQLIDGLCEIDEERFQAPAPFSPIDDPKETVGSLLTKMVAHEMYHAGQAGVLRRLIGMKGKIGQA
ncbi:MAG: DinB family protein [Gemmatimonadetes bacterium]|nr:DinB family protein [Gemmatimonadota bacterium]